MDGLSAAFYWLVGVSSYQHVQSAGLVDVEQVLPCGIHALSDRVKFPRSSLLTNQQVCPQFIKEW